MTFLSADRVALCVWQLQDKVDECSAFLDSIGDFISGIFGRRRRGFEDIVVPARASLSRSRRAELERRGLSEAICEGIMSAATFALDLAQAALDIASAAVSFVGTVALGTFNAFMAMLVFRYISFDLALSSNNFGDSSIDVRLDCKCRTKVGTWIRVSWRLFG